METSDKPKLKDTLQNIPLHALKISNAWKTKRLTEIIPDYEELRYMTHMQCMILVWKKFILFSINAIARKTAVIEEGL